jgi:hypothetical protein
VIWFHAVPAGDSATDFRTQTYQGKPVLTWWQGTGFGGLSSGTDYIYNDRYQQIAEVNAGNGYSADGHEFLITPWNTTARARSSPTSTTPKPSATTSTRCSTMSPAAAAGCCPTAGWSP